MVDSTNFVLEANGHNSCYKEWCFSGTFKWSNKKESSFLFIVYKNGNS